MISKSLSYEEISTVIVDLLKSSQYPYPTKSVGILSDVNVELSRTTKPPSSIISLDSVEKDISESIIVNFPPFKILILPSIS